MEDVKQRVADLVERNDAAGLSGLLTQADPGLQDVAWEEAERATSDCVREAVERVLMSPEPSLRSRAMQYFARHAPDTARRIAPLVDDADPSVRRSALRVLASLGQKALPHLARALKDSDGALRRIAAESIAKLRTPAALEPLLEASEDAEPSVRRVALRALSTRDDPRIAPRALRGLFDDDLPARGSAFAYLLRLDFSRRVDLLLQGAEDIVARGLFVGAENVGVVLKELPVEQLSRFLNPALSGDGAVVRSSVWALVRDELARRGDASSVDVLRRGVVEGATDVRQGCLRALRLSDSPDSDKALVSLLGRDEVVLRLGVIGELAARLTAAARDAIAHAMGDVEAQVRVAAIQAVRKKPPRDWLDRLLARREDAASEVRRIVVDELGKLKDPRAKEALVQAMEDSDAEVRRSAVRRLVGQNALELRLVPSYLAALAWPFPAEDDDWGGPVRQKIVQWLGEQGVKDALPVLAQVANEDRVLLRRMAVEAILKIGGPDALKALYRSTPQEESEAVAQAEAPTAPAMDVEEAKAILAKLANLDDPNLILEPRARDALAAFRDTPDKSVLRKVALGLGRAGDPRALVPLLRSLEECRGPMVHEAKKLIEKYPEAGTLSFLITSLKSRWTSVRRWAAERMRLQKDPRVLDPLLEAMTDEDFEVQCAVVTALGNYGSDARVVDKLIQCVTYGDISVRQVAIEALGEAQVKEAVPAIVASLTNPFLRARAEAALRHIGDRKGILAVKRVQRREAMFPKGRKAEEAKKRRLKPKRKPKP